MVNDKEQVRTLGEKIGYGQMMDLASDLWKASLVKAGYPTDGAFVPVILTKHKGKSVVIVDGDMFLLGKKI